MGVCIGIVSWHLAFVWQQQCKVSRVFGCPSKNNWEKVWTLEKRAFHVWKQSHALSISRKLNSGNKWQNVIVFLLFPDNTQMQYTNLLRDTFSISRKLNSGNEWQNVIVFLLFPDNTQMQYTNLFRDTFSISRKLNSGNKWQNVIVFLLFPDNAHMQCTNFFHDTSTYWDNSIAPYHSLQSFRNFTFFYFYFFFIHILYLMD